MLEQKWLTSADTETMLECLAYHLAGRTPGWFDKFLPWRTPRLDWSNNRKLRLWACACCRRIWNLLPSDSRKRAVEATESFSDGAITQARFEEAIAEAQAIAESRTDEEWLPVLQLQFRVDNEAISLFFDSCMEERDFATIAAWGAAWTGSWGRFAGRACLSAAAAVGKDQKAQQALVDQESLHQQALLRDLFGNPFRPASFPREILTWRDGVIPKLARSIYEERGWEHLPILGDALEDAGCSDEEILSHCRNSTPHARGCYVLDSLLCNDQT